MGYVERVAGLPDFAKAIISIWFRVPAASMTAARAQFVSTWNEDGSYDANLIGKIPLLTFGGASSFTNVNGTFNMGSSFIGINCGSYNEISDSAVTTPNIVVRLQYPTNTATGLTEDTGTCGDHFNIGYGDNLGVHNSSDVTPLFIGVSPDVWHHVLVSFDMTPGCATAPDATHANFTSACKLWLAFDDVNYNAGYFWPSYTGSYGTAATPNDIGSMWCTFYSDGFGALEQSFAAGNLRTANPLGIPSSSGNTAKIYNIEMARVAVFTGVSLDTSDETNRRAFVTASGTPEAIEVATALIGQSPDIYFKTSRNFITGTNRGTGGAFSPTGNITVYTPAPDLTP